MGLDILNLDRMLLPYGPTEDAPFGRFNFLREQTTVILRKPCEIS